MAAAGDFVKIRSGIYRETVVPTNSGSPDRPITLQSDGDAEVTVSAADPVGYTGTAPDLGAYEYGGTDWVAGCTLP